MKSSNYLALTASVALLWGGLTGCTENPLEDPGTEPSVEVTPVSADSRSATFTVNTTAITEIAYSAYAGAPETEPTADVLFMGGTVTACSDGENQITVSGLEANTGYTLYLAATTTEETYYDEILTVDFTTTDYEEDVTLVDTYYDGFSIHVKMPESVKEAGNVLRYTYGNLVMYNSNKSGWMASSDASMLEANGGQYMDDSKTITYNDDNAIHVDEFGEEVVLHDPIVPGEPIVFFAGEFGWGESIYGWGEGWYAAKFDEMAYQDALWGGTGEVNEEDYWTGYFYKTTFTAREPQVLDATVDVDCSNVQAVTGTIKFTPDDDVLQYCVVVADETSYQMVLDYLDGNEDYLQWFTTSYYASFMLGMRTFQGNTEIDLTDYLYLQEQSHYHVLVTAMGDEEGTTQSFKHVEFDTTEKTMEAPVVTVTAIESDDPFSVSFNVKNTGNVEVASALYAANYERDWAAALQNMTYADVTAYGNALSDAEVAQINSEEGLTLTFSTIDGMTTRLAVLAYNLEETANDLNAEGCPAIADNTSPDQPDAERVESELFSALEGEWTMTANTATYDYYEEGYVDNGPESIKVTVYNGINDYPEALPAEVYDYYTGMSKEEVDALYDEFKMEAESFNAKVRGQNRLLCLGFGYEAAGGYSPAFTTTTPYELFCNPEYSSYDVASLFYDFGPKWYLQVAKDGTVTAPFNSTKMYPLQAWTDNVYYLAGFGETGFASVAADGSDLAFPVEVSSDRNTVTVSPFAVEGENLYPNAVYINYGYGYLGGNKVSSALTLTKGWSGSTATSSAPAVSKKNTVKLNSLNGTSLDSNSAKPKSRTSFRTARQYKKVDDFKIVSPEELQENIRNYQQQRSSR